RPHLAGELSHYFHWPAGGHEALTLRPRAERRDDRGDLLPPLLLAPSLQPTFSDVVLVCLVAFVRQMAELHRLQLAVDDHGRAKPRAQPNKQHATALIAAQRLHCGIVDDADRHAERSLVVETDPAR